MAVTEGNTTGPKALEKPVTAPGAEAPVVIEFAVGITALWVVLTLGTESRSTSGLAAAFAVAIATGSTVLYLVKALENLGLVGASSMTKGGTP